jgi:hypothetical protein
MRVRVLAVFCAGLLVGRIASDRLGAQALGLVDSLVYIALAFAIAWAWRVWARRAFEQRRRDALARQQRGRTRSARRARDAAPAPPEGGESEADAGAGTRTGR